MAGYVGCVPEIHDSSWLTAQPCLMKPDGNYLWCESISIPVNFPYPELSRASPVQPIILPMNLDIWIAC